MLNLNAKWVFKKKSFNYLYLEKSCYQNTFNRQAELKIFLTYIT